MQTKLPTTLYIALGNYGPVLRQTVASDIGALDPTENLDDAADQLLEVEGSTGRDGRVIEVTFDFSTNQPESVRDVTDDCVSIIKRRCDQRGIAAE